MPRVKRGVQHVKRRKNLLKKAKGYKWGRKNKIKLAKVAVEKAGSYAYRDRKAKKRTNRALWQIKMSAALKAHGLSYSKFVGIARKKNLSLDRKVLSQLAEKYPESFKKVVAQVTA